MNVPAAERTTRAQWPAALALCVIVGFVGWLFTSGANAQGQQLNSAQKADVVATSDGSDQPAGTAEQPRVGTSEPPRPGGYFSTLPPGADLPSGEACARRVRASLWEPRPSNRPANHRRLAEVKLPDWSGYEPVANRTIKARIDGDFVGTTDEIIQWASCKWGFNDDLTRATAVVESAWLQDARGDLVDDVTQCRDRSEAPCPTSFGLTQIKATAHPGTYPWSLLSTAFNVDYALALRRACYEGWSYHEGDYAAGDLYGCIGSHFSGRWRDPDGLRYAARIQQVYRDKPWLSWPE